MIKIFGTAFRFHPLFSIVMLLSVLTGYFLEVVTLFAIVLLHEMGHLVAAKNLGWRIKEIRLLPFGGAAVVEELGTVPAWEEIVVAAAGPLQNGFLIVFAWTMKGAGADSAWWNYFIAANLLIGLFNMLPILPLDGGKMMQGVLSFLMPYHQAILYTTVLSVGLGALATAAALLSSLFGGIQLNLLVIGLFLVYSNWYSYRHLSYHFLRFLIARDARVREWMEAGVIAQPIVVTGQTPIGQIMKLFMREKYHLVYVVGPGGSIQAVLPEQRLTKTFFVDKKQGSAVSELFR